MSALDELSQSLTGLAGSITPSVVGIGSRLRGSGVIIADGQVLTNAHNIRGDEVTVTFADGRSSTGRLAGVDVDGDLAVIAIDTAGANAITWAEDGDGPSAGTVVFAAAATPGGGARVTFGTISAVERSFRGPGGRRIGGSLEHTAPLAPGSSGGPLVDADGRLLGLNTNRLGEGFYLALPADAALRARVEALGRGESVERPRLGIAIAPNRVARRLRQSVGLPERDGLLVRGVEDDSPAARAGIRDGDLIVEVAGRPVTDGDALQEILGTVEMPFEVKLVRGTDERTVSVGGSAAAGEA
ncbi:MAG TPA: trypsin-like peptidase domain-containing protein [Candidatus Limnocylindrales bacterium]|jgi:serine protease Do|nr:trypsin-like peptidase domain-containing protein [Candidatus Limnocylindrales bacterium]